MSPSSEHTHTRDVAVSSLADRDIVGRDIADRDIVDREYVLGTDDAEIARLGLQHHVWRPRALAAWQKAGFTLGQRILDVGCGPGYAALDLSDVVGETGRVVAVDESRRFLESLNSKVLQRQIVNVETHELNVDESAAFPGHDYDGAWCRWVLSFVHRPREVLNKVVSALRTGGTLVLHEYFDYRTWRVAPRSLLVEQFVDTVMRSWRENGGEPDIALNLPQWLGEMGMEVTSVQAIVEAVPRSSHIWEWPSAFLETNLERLVALEFLTLEKADAMRTAFREHAELPNAYMITPGLLEVIAVRR